MTTTKQEQARNAARQILAESRVTTPHVPVERIIKARKIVLQYAPLDDDLSGMAYIKDGVGIIGVNALHHPNRQRFSAAHELGHHVLHADQIREAVHVDRGIRILYRDDASSLGTQPMEVQANMFAAELLMPTSLLAGAIADGGVDIEDEASVEVLAKRFRVSTAAMRFRLLSQF